jgi:predicted small lipoprotein YifL
MDISDKRKTPKTTNKTMKAAPVSFLILAMLALLLAACGGAAPPEPTPTVDLVGALEPEATEPPEEEGLGGAIDKEVEDSRHPDP